MEPKERRIRLEVGLEILEGVLLDFLKENPDRNSNAVANALGLGYFLTDAALGRLQAQGKVEDKRYGGRHGTGSHRWRAV